MTDQTGGTGGTTTPVTRHPLDFDALQQGDYISPSQVTDATKRVGEANPPPPGTDSFRHRMLELRTAIINHMRQIGREWTVKCEGHGLRILTDPEALAYNPKRFAAGKRTMVGANRRLRGINPANLIREDRQRLEEVKRQQAMEITALLHAEDQCQIPLCEPTPRDTYIQAMLQRAQARAEITSVPEEPQTDSGDDDSQGEASPG